MNTSIKYPKTMHLLFSPNLQNDDRMIEDVHCFDGKRVSVTVKMDGENTSMYRDGIHARSLDSRHHPSRSVVKSLHSTIKNDIPKGWRVCGENMYAKHSIQYLNLDSYFLVFSVWDENNMCLPLDETWEFCRELKLVTVPFIRYVDIDNADYSIVEAEFNSLARKGEEGIVIRNVLGYHYDDFQTNVAKAVRKNHVQTDQHWMKNAVVPNQLKDEDYYDDEDC